MNTTYQQKLDRINQVIKQNGQRNITGLLLNGVLIYTLDKNAATVDMIDQGFTYTGNVYSKTQTYSRSEIDSKTFKSKGIYNPSLIYEKFDLVTNQGSSYLSRIDGNKESLTNASAWQLYAQAGSKPDHRWQGTSISFENPDGTYDPPVNLKGETGNVSYINFYVDDNMELNYEIEPDSGLVFEIDEDGYLSINNN